MIAGRCPKTTDLYLLPIAIALYDELSVSRAARQLGMSQPAVSKALRRLRETFDDPLFIRGPNGIVPTPRAHAIVRAARPHLRHLRTIAQKTSSSTRRRARGRSCWHCPTSPRWRSCLRSRPSARPRAALPGQHRLGARTQLAAGLEKGDVDVAAGYFPTLAQRNFRQRRLSRHGFACLLAPVIRSGKAADARRYLAAEHIVIRREGRSQDVLERFLTRRKMRRKVAL